MSENCNCWDPGFKCSSMCNDINSIGQPADNNQVFDPLAQIQDYGAAEFFAIGGGLPGSNYTYSSFGIKAYTSTAIEQDGSILTFFQPQGVFCVFIIEGFNVMPINKLQLLLCLVKQGC